MVTVRIRSVIVMKAGWAPSATNFAVTIVVTVTMASVTTGRVSVRKAGMENIVHSVSCCITFLPSLKKLGCTQLLL